MLSGYGTPFKSTTGIPERIPPEFSGTGTLGEPPHTIIFEPVHIAAWPNLAVGAPVVLVADIQESVAE